MEPIEHRAKGLFADLMGSWNLAFVSIYAISFLNVGNNHTDVYSPYKILSPESAICATPEHFAAKRGLKPDHSARHRNHRSADPEKGYGRMCVNDFLHINPAHPLLKIPHKRYPGSTDTADAQFQSHPHDTLSLSAVA
jgi:hypothetical protein